MREGKSRRDGDIFPIFPIFPIDICAVHTKGVGRLLLLYTQFRIKNV